MSEHREPIPSMIYNAAVGGHVTNSQQIIDENENKEQSQINVEVKQILGQGGSVDTRIANAVNIEKTRAEKAEEQLRQAYEALSQSQPIPVTELPATGEAGKIYRLAGTTSYADYMYAEGALTTPIKMAEYDNAIDDEPTTGSSNLVKSGGVYNKTNVPFIKSDLLNFNFKYLPYCYPEVVSNPGYVTLLNYNKLDCVRINSSFIDSFKLQNGVTSATYRGVVSVDNNNAVLRYWGATCNITAEDLVGSTYVYVTLRNNNSSTHANPSIIINGEPFMNSFIEALPVVPDFTNTNELLNFANKYITVYKNKFPSIENEVSVELLDHARLYTYRIELVENIINSIIAYNLKYNVTHYYGLILTDASNNIISSSGVYDTKASLSSKDFDNAKYCYLVGLPWEVFLIINGFPYTYNAFKKAVEIAAQKTGVKLIGKTLWTIGDSLFENTWQEKFVELTGCTFYPNLNTGREFPLSVGGTTSMPEADDGTQARCLNLKKYKNTYPIDYIFIENVNDNTFLPDRQGGSDIFVGTINDAPIMRSQKIVLTPPTPVTTNAEARAWITNNWTTIISDIPIAQKKRGTILSIPITPASGTVNGSKIAFNGTISNAGTLTMNIAGIDETISVSVEATVGMTIQQVIDNFLRYSYGVGVVDIDNGDGSMTIFSNISSTVRITSFDGASTGLSATITDTVGVSNYGFMFIKGYTAQEFDDIDNWDSSYGVTLYGLYKGILEYLMTEFPTAKIYWVFPYSVNPGSFSSNQYKNADGTWSQDKFKQAYGYYNRPKLYAIQKEVCEFYDVPYLDIFNKCGISINNIEEYFYQNNVHPKQSGYDRWAVVMANMI